MLAKILEDMWVEPEVLEALSEDQKRILFLKMREEQVRRWREREEREEREGADYQNQKKVSSKHVSWLLGRDGDVSVSIIGEVDEFRSSKLLQNLMNNRLCSDNMNCVQTVELLPGREAQQLSFKEDLQLPLADVSDDAPSPNEQSSEEESSSADDDLKDPVEDSDSESGSGSDNLVDWAPLYRTHLSRHDNQALKAQLSDTERSGPQDKEIVCIEKKPGGRVAQLRKAFADDPRRSSPASNKPPLPAKPAHLQNRSTSLIR